MFANHHVNLDLISEETKFKRITSPDLEIIITSLKPTILLTCGGFSAFTNGKYFL